MTDELLIVSLNSNPDITTSFIGYAELLELELLELELDDLLEELELLLLLLELDELLDLLLLFVSKFCPLNPLALNIFQRLIKHDCHYVTPILIPMVNL